MGMTELEYHQELRLQRRLARDHLKAEVQAWTDGYGWPADTAKRLRAAEHGRNLRATVDAIKAAMDSVSRSMAKLRGAFQVDQESGVVTHTAADGAVTLGFDGALR